MNRPNNRWPRPTARDGYTLIEVLTATLLAMMILSGLVVAFARMSDSITDARAFIEKVDEFEHARETIARDLEGLTVVPDPMRRGARNGYLEIIEGPRGPVWPLYPPIGNAATVISTNLSTVNLERTNSTDNLNGVGETDSTVGDNDDAILFTTNAGPFIGRALIKRRPNSPAEWASQGSLKDGHGEYVLEKTATSNIAEVIYFLRGRTLYRRVLLVLPEFDADLRTPEREMQLDPWGYLPLHDFDPPVFNGTAYYDSYDISMVSVPDPSLTQGKHTGGNFRLLPSSLSDLAQRERRYAHQSPGGGYPYDARAWGLLGFPTLAETSYGAARDAASFFSSPWIAGRMFHGYNPADGSFNLDLVVEKTDLTTPTDVWRAPHPWKNVDQAYPAGSEAAYRDNPYVDWQNGTHTPEVPNPAAPEPPAYMGRRVTEDVLLTNVLAFDVKVWDPQAPVLCKKLGNGQTVAVEPGDPAYPHPARGEVTVMETAVNNLYDSTADICIGQLGAFVDLNYFQGFTYGIFSNAAATQQGKAVNLPCLGTSFDGPGHPKSGLAQTPDATGIDQLSNQGMPSDTPQSLLEHMVNTRVWDSWCWHYESNWQDNCASGPDGLPNAGDLGDETSWLLADGLFDEGRDGIDNDADGSIDEPDDPNDPVRWDPTGYLTDEFRKGENETMPPYPTPLRGIQITLRVYEPDSQQIREVKIVREFLPR